MPGTARQYQNARAVPLLDKVFWLGGGLLLVNVGTDYSSVSTER